jgi:hypothetical protein
MLLSKTYNSTKTKIQSRQSKEDEIKSPKREDSYKLWSSDKLLYRSPFKNKDCIVRRPDAIRREEEETR